VVIEAAVQIQSERGMFTNKDEAKTGLFLNMPQQCCPDQEKELTRTR
jgi:hypothetical protein